MPSPGWRSLPSTGPQLPCGPAATRTLSRPRSLPQAGPRMPHSRWLSQLLLAHQLSLPEHSTSCDLPGSCIVLGLSHPLPGAPWHVPPGTVVTVGPLPCPSCTLDGTVPSQPVLLPGPLPPSLAPPPAPGVSLGLLTQPCGITGRLSPPCHRLTWRALHSHHVDQSPLSPVLALDLKTQREEPTGSFWRPLRWLLRDAGSADGRWAAFFLEMELWARGAERKGQRHEAGAPVPPQVPQGLRLVCHLHLSGGAHLKLMTR